MVKKESEAVRLLPSAEKYLKVLLPAEQAMVVADINDIRNGNFAAVRTKQLRGAIRELIVGHHRFTYFRLLDTLYFVRGFRKKTAKTPLQEIEYANNVYKIMKINV